ncbi:cellulase family glycosylhydrolase [Mycobacterium sp. BMJ-28]
MAGKSECQLGRAGGQRDWVCVRRRMIYPTRKYSRAVTSIIVSVLTLSLLFVVPTSQRHRPVGSGQVAPLAASSSTLGFADSQVFFYNDDQVAQTVARWTANNIHTVRIGIPWAAVEAQKGTFDWTRADRVVTAAAAANVSIICAITSSPQWAAAAGSIPPHGRPASPDAYGDFTAQVAQRYRGKIAAYEIWNEPNGIIGYRPLPDPAGYTDLLKAAYPKIKAVDPSAVVIGGVLGSGKSWGTWTINPVTFLTKMYAAGAAPYFDALSYHPYSYNMKFSDGMYQSDSALDQLVRLRQIMLANNEGAKSIWVTEFGAPTNRVSEATQAALMSDMISSWRQLPYGGPLMLYTTRDLNSGSWADDDRFGVYRSNWTAKPSQQVVQSPPGPNAAYPRFAAITDPALGEVLSPVFAATSKVWAQLRTAGTLWELTPGQFVWSPGQVGDVARARRVIPTTAFANGYQDFTGSTPVRIWYSPATGAHWGSREFVKAWVPQLGLATSDEKWTGASTRVTFENGSITWTPFVGAKVYFTQQR